MKRRRWIAVLVLVPTLAVTALSLASCEVPTLGLRDGRLLPCSSRPNCVSSLATDEAHRADALPLRTGAAEAQAELKRIALALPRATMLEERDNYLRFQHASLIFRFKDDLEFHLAPAEGLIHVRAAARVGYSDMGVNRARVETVRERYTAWLANRPR